MLCQHAIWLLLMWQNVQVALKGTTVLIQFYYGKPFDDKQQCDQSCIQFIIVIAAVADYLLF